MDKSLLYITGWAHGPGTLAPLAEAIGGGARIATGAQVLAERRLPEADFIVAHSMGGLLAIELLPARCKGLVLLASTARFCAAEGYGCGVPERVLRRMAVQFGRNPEAVLEEFFRNAHYPQETAAPPSPGPEAPAAGLDYLLAADVRGKVAGLGIPVLLLHGTDDRIVPPAASEWLHARLPDSRLELFDGAGHALAAHRCAAVAEAIGGFLRILAAKPRQPTFGRKTGLQAMETGLFYL